MEYTTVKMNGNLQKSSQIEWRLIFSESAKRLCTHTIEKSVLGKKMLNTLQLFGQTRM